MGGWGRYTFDSSAAIWDWKIWAAVILPYGRLMRWCRRSLKRHSKKNLGLMMELKIQFHGTAAEPRMKIYGLSVATDENLLDGVVVFKNPDGKIVGVITDMEMMHGRRD